MEIASIAQRMSWAARRRTSRLEDEAYCLMGIFGINMPLLYGEGENAFIRLQHEIMRVSNDHSLFAWKSADARGGVLATCAAAFRDCRNIIQLEESDAINESFTINNIGISLDVPFIGIGPQGHGLALLNCKQQNQADDKRIAIHIRDVSLTMTRFTRIMTQ